MLYVVTGFSNFAGVEDNPTEQLVKLLREHCAAQAVANGSPGPAYRVLGTEVLEVSAQPVRQWLEQLYSSVLAPTAVGSGSGGGGGGSNNGSSGAGNSSSGGSAAAAAAAVPEDVPVVMVHLGVDVRGDHLKLEQQAFNEATFRVPDQRGWQPQQQLIDDHPGCGLGTVLHTGLDLRPLTERLQAQQHNVRPSHDAGRFVCNWIYYLSLLHSQKQRQRCGRPLHALFVHVPPAEAIPLKQQFSFLLDLLQAIALQLGGGSGGGGGVAGPDSLPGTPVPAVVEPAVPAAAAAVAAAAVEPAVPVAPAAVQVLAGASAAAPAASGPGLQ